MIRKVAIRKFIERERQDFRRYKELSDAEVEHRVQALPVEPPIWHKLEKHQKICFLIGAEQRRFFFCNDTGTGKTMLSIALVRYFRRLGLLKRVLILVPRRAVKDEWANELRKHSPKSTYTVLEGSSKQKWDALLENDNLFVIETYAGLSRMVCALLPQRGKNKLVPDKQLVQQLQEQFQGFVGDESHNLKSYNRLPFRICRQLARSSSVVFLLTGTPFNRDPTDLWSQAFLIDSGKTLGETLGLFRAALFRQSTNPFGGFEYTFMKDKRKLLNRMLANCSIAYEADAASLPRVVHIRKVMRLTSDAEEYFERAKQTIIGARGNFREMKNAFVRIRQLSSGFVGFADDETGEKAKFVFPENPKLDMLLALVEGIPRKYKIIIFYEFTYSGLRIVKELKDLGIAAAHMYGQTKDQRAVREQFLSDSDSTDGSSVLVLQNAFGEGLNLQIAKYGIYYESPVSAITRKQTTRRIERQRSQHGSVFIYDLIMDGTADEKILSFHRQGRDLFQALIRGEINL